MKKMLTNKAFTLMEIMIVTIIVGIMAAFAIPNYSKSVEQTHLQDAMIQLSAIRAANQVYYARTSNYWPGAGTHLVDEINSVLSLNIIPNGLAFTCGGTGTTFNCTATRNGGAYTVTVNETPLSPGVNPACSSGTCP